MHKQDTATLNQHALAGRIQELQLKQWWIARQIGVAPLTVNRWLTTGFLAASATTNETAWTTYKVVRSMGMLVFDNQARV